MNIHDKKPFIIVSAALVLSAILYQQASAIPGMVKATVDWVISGNNITFTSGNVGIGTASPSALLQVSVNQDITSSPTFAKIITAGQDGYSHFTFPSSVFVAGNYAYVTSYNNPGGGYTIIDITNPENPIRKSAAYDNDGQFTKLSSSTDSYVSGNYAYVISYEHALTIMDVSNPTAPILKAEIVDDVGGYDRMAYPSGVAVRGNTAYVTSRNDAAITVIDVTNPASPTHIKDCFNSQCGMNVGIAPNNMTISGDYLYVTNQVDHAVQIFNISSATNPYMVTNIFNNTGGYTKLSSPIKVYVKNNLMYVYSGGADNAITIIDVTNPGSPVKKAEFWDGDGQFSHLSSGGTPGIYVSGKYLYIAAWDDDALTIVDISNPTSPTKVAELVNGTNGINSFDGLSSVSGKDDYVFALGRFSNKLNILKTTQAINALTAKDNGKVGIGTADPQATLDIRGFIRIATQSAAPTTCNLSTDGSISLTSGYKTCVCKNGTGWVYTSDGSTSCTW